MINEVNVLEYLTPTDWAVFVAVLAVTFAAVIFGNVRRRRMRDPSWESDLLDLLLMGRRLTLPLFTATLVATWYGGIFSVTEYAHEVGIYNWLTQGVFWYAAYLIFAFALVKRIRGSEARTMPELLGGMFGPRAAKLGAWLNLLNVLPVTYLLMLGIFLEILFGGSLAVWMALGILVVAGYSTLGGFRSVVFSDLVQFSVMCSSVALVIVFSMTSFGGIGWLRNHPEIPAGHWKPLGDGIPLSLTLVWGFLALGTLVDPNFYQRCLAAKDIKTARKGILLATVVWVGFDFCTTFGALYARAALPAAEPRTAYLLYSIQLLPPGLSGFFLAGVLATILSTLDSYLFLSGTLVAYDLAPVHRKGQLRFLHLGTVLMAVIALLAAWIFHLTGENLVGIWKFFGGYATACILLPLLSGHIWPGKIQDRTFVTSCLSGMLLMTLYHVFRTQMPFSDIEPFYFGLLGTLLPLLFSAVTKRKPA